MTVQRCDVKISTETPDLSRDIVQDICSINDHDNISLTTERNQLFDWEDVTSSRDVRDDTDERLDEIDGA